jgi:hypothetical protein
MTNPTTKEHYKELIRQLINGDINRDRVVSGSEFATYVLPRILKQFGSASNLPISMEECLADPRIGNVASGMAALMNAQLPVLNGEQAPTANDRGALEIYQDLRKSEPELGQLPRQVQLPTPKQSCSGLTQRGT